MSMLNMLLGAGGKTFKAQWSGNALVTTNTGWIIGLENSNSNYRFRNNTAYGSVCSVSSFGIFSGDSVADDLGISVSSNLIRVSMNLGLGSGTTYGGWVTFDIKNCAFTGTSYVWQDDGDGGYSSTFETSGGLLRYGLGPTKDIKYRSPYISLT